MSEYNIHKSPIKSVRMYHFVFQAEYRNAVFSKEVDITLKDICLEMSKRFEIEFLEIGTDKKNVHFLVQRSGGHSERIRYREISELNQINSFAAEPERVSRLFQHR